MVNVRQIPLTDFLGRSLADIVSLIRYRFSANSLIGKHSRGENGRTETKWLRWVTCVVSNGPNITVGSGGNVLVRVLNRVIITPNEYRSKGNGYYGCNEFTITDNFVLSH